MEWIAWPAVVLLVVVFGLLLFKKNISGLIDRAESVKAPGLDVSATPSQLTAVAETPQSAVSPEIPNVLVLEPAAAPVALIEAEIRETLGNLPSGDRASHVNLLVRTVAQLRVANHHERHYRVIYGSQITVLRQVNVGSIKNTAGATPWFDWFRTSSNLSTSFDDWMQFLVMSGYLVRVPAGEGQSDHLAITDLGKDFLAWMAYAGVNEAKQY